MSETEKPLHVQVAEALGWEELAYEETEGLEMDWQGNQPSREGAGIAVRFVSMMRVPVPRYDTDWSATGPLIVRFGLGLQAPELPGRPWGCYDVHTDVTWHRKEPLLAVCAAILGLKAAGKLR